MNKVLIRLLIVLLLLSVTGCSAQVIQEGNTTVTSSPAAQEETVTDTEQSTVPKESDEVETSYEVRDGVQWFELRYDDLTAEYQVSSDFSYTAMNRRPPLPKENVTVLNAEPNPKKEEVFYLWEEGNMPGKTVVTPENAGNYDPYDFRPYVTALTVPEGVEVKGAVVLLAGGSVSVSRRLHGHTSNCGAAARIWLPMLYRRLSPAPLLSGGRRSRCGKSRPFYSQECGTIRYRPGRYSRYGLFCRRNSGG